MWLTWFLLSLICLPVVSLWAYNFVRLRRMPYAALRDCVCELPRPYFDFIGEDNPAVREFCNLVVGRKYEELYSAWPRLQRSFLQAEQVRGHRGRPLLLDYFCSYRSFVRELIRRGS